MPGEDDDEGDVEGGIMSHPSSVSLQNPPVGNAVAGPSVARACLESASAPDWELDRVRRRFLGREAGARAHYAALEAEQEELASRMSRLQLQMDEVAQAIIAQDALLQEMSRARLEGNWGMGKAKGKGKGKE